MRHVRGLACAYVRCACVCMCVCVRAPTIRSRSVNTDTTKEKKMSLEFKPNTMRQTLSLPFVQSRNSALDTAINAASTNKHKPKRMKKSEGWRNESVVVQAVLCEPTPKRRKRSRFVCEKAKK